MVVAELAVGKGRGGRFANWGGGGFGAVAGGSLRAGFTGVGFFTSPSEENEAL